MTSAPVKMISQLDQIPFVDEWYELADEKHFWMQYRSERILEEIRRLSVDLDRPLKVLDIGCGRGVAAHMLERATQWSIDGCDLDIHALRECQDRRGENLFYDIHEKNAEFSGAYDVVLLLDVLEHIENRKAFLDSCLWHLKEDGCFVINVPAMSLLFSAYDVAAGHYCRYSAAALKKELQGQMLDQERLCYWGATMVPLLLLRKLLIKIGLMSKNVIRQGFKPPNSFLNFFLKRVLRIEGLLWRSPPLGTSIIYIGKKSR